MPQSPDDITARLNVATQPGAREYLVRRGLARGMIWRDGHLPPGAPPFSASLTEDLLDHGYGVLAQALRLREVGGAPADVERALLVAAESIESAVRRGAADRDRDFHLVIAACAFHLAHYAARAFCLVPSPEIEPNLSTPERALVALMRRSLSPLREVCARWLRDVAHSDEVLTASLGGGGDYVLDDVEQIALTSNFVRSIATFLTALERGDAELAAKATDGFAVGGEAAGQCRHIPLWWANTLALHLTDDLWSNSLHHRLPLVLDGAAGSRWEALRRRYIQVLRGRSTAEVDLWPSQWEAAHRCVDPTDDLVVALPTSAGKTRIAELCILRALADKRRVVYVTPLRALSAQLERTLGRTFRPLGYTVTALYGASGVAAADVATLRDADIVVATPEKLDFALRVDPAVLDDVGLVVLDEGHMIGLGTREIRYEVLVQRLLRRSDASRRRIVCLSAIFAPDGGADDGSSSVEAVSQPGGAIAFRDFTAWIRSDAPGDPIASAWRPTRQRSGVLRWGESGGRLEVTVDKETPYVPGFVLPEAPRGRRTRGFPKNDNEFVLAAAKAFLADEHRVLIYCPQRRSVETLGEELLVLERQGYFPSVLQPEADIARALRIGREWLGEDHVALRALQKGVALHHGALPRAFLSEIENLLQRRVLRLVIASPTLAQGIDLSCSVLIFRSIYRFGNEVISPEEFANVVGRAGRAYVDLDGITVFPVFDTGWSGRQRVTRYKRLVRDSANRRLESGLVMLVEMLIDLLSSGLGVTRGELREYVLDVGSAWDVQVLDPAIDGSQGRELVAPVLAELDAALLGSIEDLACSPEHLADALDAALHASLWVRRLAHREEASAELCRDVLVGRAKWLWARTAPSARRGYHAAGVGYATGKFLDEHQVALVRLLRSAEASLLLGDFERAADHVVELARPLSSIPPFAFEHAAGDWENTLGAWVRGQPLASGGLGNAVAFVQNDVVYRLVWGVEAIRVHAVQTGAADADLLTGTVAATLTYGVPTSAGVVLAQCGLSSRSMIMRLLAAFPATFSSTNGLREWLAEHRSASEAHDFWDDPESAAMWQAFVRRWVDGGAERWSNRRMEAEVLWTASEATPRADTFVSLVHDSVEDVTYVCGPDLSTLGRLTAPLTGENGAVEARVGMGANQIVIDTFGP